MSVKSDVYFTVSLVPIPTDEEVGTIAVNWRKFNPKEEVRLGAFYAQNDSLAENETYPHYPTIGYEFINREVGPAKVLELVDQLVNYCVKYNDEECLPEGESMLPYVMIRKFHKEPANVLDWSECQEFPAVAWMNQLFTFYFDMKLYFGGF